MTDLRELLSSAASVDPDLSPAERSAAVARRGRAARRRDRALVGGAAIAVLAAAAAVPLALQGGDGPDTHTASEPPTPAITASPCPAQPVPVDRPAGPLDLDDVIAVRACPADGEQGEPLPSQPMIGVMAAAFAEDVAALPAWQMPDMCAAISIMPQPWALQIETADGTTAVVGSTMRLCSAVSVGGVDRGADAVLAAFLGNQVRQASGIPELACPPPDQVARLADGAPTWNASFDPSTAVAGVACYRSDPMGQSDYGDLQAIDATLSPVHGQLEAVRDDLAANRVVTGGDGMCTDTGPQRMILLEDADGDQAAWVDDRCTGEFSGPGGSWSPGPEAEQAIDDALRGR